MIRSVAGKVAWVGRTAAMVFGLALVLALVLGVGTMALAAVPGDPFELGETNTINNALTTLRGSNAGGSMLVVDNDSSAAGSRALDLRVEEGRAPINVNAGAGRAANLNADKVDGKGADQIGVNGIEEVLANSAVDSDSGKEVTARCPAGKVLVGSGYTVAGGKTGLFPDQVADVVVTVMDPLDTAVFVKANEIPPGTTDTWSVIAHALCATEGTP